MAIFGKPQSRSDGACRIKALSWIANRLLLVVDGGGGEFFALRVGPGDGDGAALAIGGDFQFTGHGDFSGFLHGHLQVVVILGPSAPVVISQTKMISDVPPVYYSAWELGEVV